MTYTRWLASAAFLLCLLCTGCNVTEVAFRDNGFLHHVAIGNGRHPQNPAYGGATTNARLTPDLDSVRAIAFTSVAWHDSGWQRGQVAQVLMPVNEDFQGSRHEIRIRVPGGHRIWFIDYDANGRVLSIRNRPG